jgi:hypothetical protein
MAMVLQRFRAVNLFVLKAYFAEASTNKHHTVNFYV